MSRQDKSTSERHTKTLRELVKRPENKVCADCKRNDPRWASWNLGVFLCIRCSGIHRGMGTHISKIKSVDLDIWTPEQMDSIQKWGNDRANLYWEAHLKPGHVPAEHKMESFIRSKYESRRWALEGPLPRDPSVLENNREHPPDPVPPPPPPQQTSAHKLRGTAPAQRQSHTLLSSQTQPTQPKSRDSAQAQSRPPGAAAPIVPTPTPQDDLFSLDFHAPPTSPDGQKKDVKNDILSLFASTPAPGTGLMAGGKFGLVQQQAAQSAMGGAGTGMGGTQTGWNRVQAGQPTQDNIWGQQQHAGQPTQGGIWGQQQPPPQQFGAFSGSTSLPQSPGFTGQSVWGGSGAATGADLFSAPFSTTASPQTAKKDDAFGDLWGSFK